jgi:hypothetical protein
MSLNKLEREVITDSMLKIQSIQASLGQIDDSKLPEIDAIHTCLKHANKTFRAALRVSSPHKKSTR